MQSPKNHSVSLYIHWPYCLSKCPYCDFASTVSPRIDEDSLLAGYERDIDRFLTCQSISTIFWGGGTPSLMSPSLMEKLLIHIQKKGSLLPDCEITLEANPDAIDLIKMKDFYSLGVNRLSLGVQSLNPENLLFLGRRHSVQTVLTRISEAQSVFPRINIDLIYALPGQTLSDWEKELTQALSLGLKHYSLYQLTIEENTVFGKKGIRPALENTATDLYCLTDRMMTAAGCPAYEVSNYASPGEECRHNLTYWRGGDYIGIGPAAHGRLGLLATENPRSVHAWLRDGSHETLLTPQEKKTERLLMGLRLRQEWFKADDLPTEKIQHLVEQGLLEQSKQGIRPTLKGTLVLDKLILELMD